MCGFRGPLESNFIWRRRTEGPAMICDCHVNIWNPEHVRPSFEQQLSRVRPGDVGMRADADSIYEAMRDVDRAILFTLGYGDSIGIEGDDDVTAAAVRKYPHKF